MFETEFARPAWQVALREGGYPTQFTRQNLAKSADLAELSIDVMITMLVALELNPNMYTLRRLLRDQVTKSSKASWYEFDRSTELRPAAPGGTPQGGKSPVSHIRVTEKNTSLTRKVHAVDEKKDRIAQEDSPITVADVGVQAANSLYLRSEIDGLARLFDTAAWGFNATGVDANPTGTQFVFWDDASSKPVKDVDRWRSMIRKRSGGMNPNAMLVTEDVHNALKTNQSILAGLSGVVDGNLPKTEEYFSKIFGCRYVVHAGVYESADMGLASSLNFMGSRQVWFGHLDDRTTANRRMRTAMRRFSWGMFDQIRKLASITGIPAVTKIEDHETDMIKCVAKMYEKFAVIDNQCAMTASQVVSTDGVIG